MSQYACGQDSNQILLNESGFFQGLNPTGDIEGGKYGFFYDTCTSSLEIPLWDNPEMQGQPKAYATTRYKNSSLKEYDRHSTQEFKYYFEDFRKDDFAPSELKKQWYSKGFINGQLLFEDQTDALKRKIESWPIRSVLVIKQRSSESSPIEINTFVFDQHGNVVDGSEPKIKKRVGFACSSLFIIKDRILKSSMSAQEIGLSYYAPEQRLCNFFPEQLSDINGFTVGSLDAHRKKLLEYCKSEFFNLIKADKTNQKEIEEDEKWKSPKHLQSFIPSELDLSKPIESNNFILTVRFSDPVKPVYHVSLPNQCLVDCPNTGAKQIEGLELKIKPIEDKKKKKK